MPMNRGNSRRRHRSSNGRDNRRRPTPHFSNIWAAWTVKTLSGTIIWSRPMAPQPAPPKLRQSQDEAKKMQVDRNEED
jgi:hypothetical protein